MVLLVITDSAICWLTCRSPLASEQARRAEARGFVRVCYEARAALPLVVLAVLAMC